MGGVVWAVVRNGLEVRVSTQVCPLRDYRIQARRKVK